ncbi:unnamed protein product [Danaus chrysippus]|uniref:(African queen) hypothetical protein n=1 Tax=Danaus chrysippus TaxID=151541 RepID=A0A8J2QP67_9NEOP|nr:unnamed protein product [Danaus chrysippus]
MIIWSRQDVGSADAVTIHSERTRRAASDTLGGAVDDARQQPTTEPRACPESKPIGVENNQQYFISGMQSQIQTYKRRVHTLHYTTAVDQHT